MRIVHVKIPHFPVLLELLRRPYLRNVTVLVTKTIKGRVFVYDFSADISGVAKDMLLSKAEMLLDKPHIIGADISYYETRSNQVCRMLREITPRVEEAALGQFYLDTRGVQKSDLEIVMSILQDVIPICFAPCVGIGRSKFFAKLAADMAKPGSYHDMPDSNGSQLNHVSVESLPISQSAKEQLRVFGLQTLGEISSLTLDILQEQFGKEGWLMWELMQGNDTRPLLTQRTSQALKESAYFFTPPVTRNSIFHVVKKLVHKILISIPEQGSYISSAVVEGTSFSGSFWKKRVTFRDPVRDDQQIAEKVEAVLAKARFAGGLESITVSLQGVTVGYGRQISLFDNARTQDNLRYAIMQMEAKWGHQLLYKVQPMNLSSKIPERRYRLE